MQNQPPKCTFSYLTPSSSLISILNQPEISQGSANAPKIVHQEALPLRKRLVNSGFLVGEPVAFVDQPQLPQGFKPFMPKLEQIAVKKDGQIMHHQINQLKPRSESLYLNQTPIHPAHFSLNSSYRPISSFPQSPSPPKNLNNQPSSRISQLEQQNRQLKERLSKMTKYVEQCRQNCLKEARLLLDRYRLEKKGEEIDGKN